MQRWRPCRHRSVTPDLCRLRAGAGQPGPAGCSGRPADLARWFTADDDASDSGKHFFLSVLLLLSLFLFSLFVSFVLSSLLSLVSMCLLSLLFLLSLMSLLSLLFLLSLLSFRLPCHSCLSYPIHNMRFEPYSPCCTMSFFYPFVSIAPNSTFLIFTFSGPSPVVWDGPCPDSCCGAALPNTTGFSSHGKSGIVLHYPISLIDVIELRIYCM